MGVLWTANVLDKATELITQSGQDLIFVLNGFLQRKLVQVVVDGGGQGVPSRKGMSSSLVRSGPRARAMVDRRRMAFNLSKTSSC